MGKLASIIFFWCITSPLFTQTIDIKTSKTVDHFLFKVEKAYDINFVYNADLINGDSSISYHQKCESWKDHLDHVFFKKFTYKQLGRNVIIKRNDANELNKSYCFEFAVNLRSETKALSNASIYLPDANKSYLTDTAGKASFKLIQKTPTTTITFSKKGYFDSLLVVKSGIHNLNIQLRPYPLIHLDQSSDTNIQHVAMEDMTIVKLLVPKKKRFEISNLQHLVDIEMDGIQLSFLPFLGSNGFKSASTSNEVSFNVLAGYNGAVDGVEVGLGLNMVKEDVHGIQIGAFGNIVGNETHGIQIAGAFNNNRSTLDGMQISGFSNINLGYLEGIQATGFSNINKGNLKGVQITGFSNINGGDLSGSQISAFSNINGQEVDGTQIGGFFNYSKSTNGGQISAFMNVSKEEVDGIQVSPFYNRTKSLNGVQVSGFINNTDTVRGVQVGVFNFADTVAKGVSVGVLSFIKNGYRAIELGRQRNGKTYYIAYKTGLRKFHNSIRISQSNNDYGYRIGAGYGIGTTRYINKRETLSFEQSITSSWFYYENAPKQGFNLDNEIGFKVNLKMKKNWSIYYGQMFHFYTMKDEMTEAARRHFNHTSHFSAAGNNLYYYRSSVLGINF